MNSRKQTMNTVTERKIAKMEKKAIQSCYLNIETLRKDKQMTWEERMNYLMPKMNIGVQKEFLEEIQIETETTPPKKTSKRNSAPVKKKYQNQPLTSTVLYITQTDLQAVRTPDVSLIPKSSKAKEKRGRLLNSPVQLTVTRPEHKLRHLTSTPNCSRKGEQLEIDLSVIQPPTQEDELEIHSSTLVNSMEIAAPEDSVELPPPLDLEQVMEFNQKSKGKKITFDKTNEECVKKKVANVLTKHGELFKFKSKVTEILHKAREFTSTKKAEDSIDDDKNNDFEGEVSEEIDEDQGQGISDRKCKVSDRASEEISDQEKGLEDGAGDISAIHSDVVPLQDFNQNKQRRLSFKDLSIHELELQPESNEETNNCTTPQTPRTSERRKSFTSGERAKNNAGASFCTPLVKHRESLKRNNSERNSGKYRHSLESGKMHTSHFPRVFKPVAHDDLCSWRQTFRKKAVVSRCTYPRTSASIPNTSVDDILINFLNVTF